jgi:uncharacterized protein
VSLGSDILARRLGLPAPRTRDVVCLRDLRAPMDDGVELLADRWVAADAVDVPQPTVLVRSPYGRRQIIGLILGRLLAERGLQVVLQSVRGTFGSGGSFNPFDERADGLATLRWLRAQPWHRDRIGMLGPSYLGIVQWAVAPEAGPDLSALSISVSASQFHGQAHAGGSISLESAVSWLVMVAAQEQRLAPFAMVRGLRKLPAQLSSDSPLAELDTVTTGAEVAWYREALSSAGRTDAYWAVRDYAAGVGEVSAAVQLVGGWYDIFLPWMLEDFAALQAAGRSPQLVIGPWTHTHPGLMRESMRDGLAWLRAHLLDDDRLVRTGPPVRILVTGDGGGWRELPTWPPPGVRSRALFLGPEGSLASEAPEAAGSSRYRYDPSDPTPSLGGPVLLSQAPVVDNAPLEARADVLTFSTPPLPAAVEAVGPARVELFVSTDNPHFDVFARVCDVDADGVSRNVTDALMRVVASDEDDVVRVAFDLWPLGHRFAAGHRIRLQVSSGAHPRYARNPGTGEEASTATELRPVSVSVLFGGSHPSAVFLPSAS